MVVLFGRVAIWDLNSNFSEAKNGVAIWACCYLEFELELFSGQKVCCYLGGGVIGRSGAPDIAEVRYVLQANELD